MEKLKLFQKAHSIYLAIYCTHSLMKIWLFIEEDMAMLHEICFNDSPQYKKNINVNKVKETISFSNIVKMFID